MHTLRAVSVVLPKMLSDCYLPLGLPVSQTARCVYGSACLLLSVLQPPSNLRSGLPRDFNLETLKELSLNLKAPFRLIRCFFPTFDSLLPYSIGFTFILKLPWFIHCIGAWLQAV
jgi:hypothetical protein